MQRRWISAAVTLCVLFSNYAKAFPVHNLPDLVDSSDLVALVRVGTVTQTGSGQVQVSGQTIPAHFRVATLHVESTLKGIKPESDLLTKYTILYSPSGWSGGVPSGYSIVDSLTPDRFRIVFLKKVAD